MRLDSPRPAPALFEFPDEPERAECWGRLLELGGDGARLLCAARVAKGARLRLRFELPGGARVERLEGDARSVETDADGYATVSLLWREQPERESLRKALLDLFARTT